MGGRVLDGVVSPIDVLPAIVQALPDTVPVLMDSGPALGNRYREGPGAGCPRRADRAAHNCMLWR